MPWPSNVENILSGILITVSDIAAERTDMGTHGQRFLHDLTTLETLLRSKARIHSYHCVPSSLSLFTQDVEKRAPTGIHDTLCQGMILDHVEYRQLLNSNHLIVFSVLFCCLIMEVTTLPLDLEMGLCRATCGLALSMRTFFASAHHALFASERLLRRAIEVGILNRITLRVREERFQPYINTNGRMRTYRWSMLIRWFSLAHDKGIPMPIRSIDKKDCFRFALYQAMQLDFEGLAYLGRDNEMLLVLMQIHILTVLSQLERVPAVRLFKAGETHCLSQLSESKIAFEGFGEAICKGLYCGSRYILTATSLKTGGQLILAWERPFLSVLCFDDLQHLIIQLSSFRQALHEQTALFLVWIETVLKCSHRCMLLGSLEYVKLSIACGRQFTHMAEASDLLPFEEASI